MIILSGVLVVVAIGLLVAGIVAGGDEGAQVLGLEALTVIYISIAVSIVSALCLAIGVFLRRRELFGSSAATARTKRAKRTRKTADRKTKDKARQTPAPALASAAPVKPGTSAKPARVPDEALVQVVPGRKRYHLASCRQVAGRQTEELTYAEAREEGFSPCTACMPDTALAARAAVSPPEATTARSDRSGTTGTTGMTGETGKSDKSDKLGTSGKDDQPAKAPSSNGGTAVLSKPEAPARPAPTSPWPAEPPAERSAARPPVPTQPRPEPAPAKPSPSGADPQVRILSGTKRYHRADCALIDDIGDDAADLEALPLSEAHARGCTPCLVCQPDRAHAPD